MLASLQVMEHSPRLGWTGVSGILCPSQAENNGANRPGVPILDMPRLPPDHCTSSMQFSRRGQPAPLGVLYDSSLDGGIDQVLALAMLFGFAALQQVRIPSLTTSRLQPAECGVSRRGCQILFRGSRGRFRAEQDSAADWDGLDRQASRVGAADGVGAAGETRRGRHSRLSRVASRS